MINTMKYLLLIATLLVPCLVYGADPSADLSVQVVPPTGNHGLLRGRPHIANGTLVAEDGSILRGVHTHLIPEAVFSQWYNSLQWWQDIHNIGHFNVMRVYGYTGIWCRSTYQASNLDMPGLLSILDSVVNLAAQTGMYVMLAETNCEDPTDWTKAQNFWANVAPRYANNTNVIYELKNEPAPNFDPSGMAARMNTLYAQVRGLAPNTPIVAWSFGNILTEIDVMAALSAGNQINYSNAVVGYHGYDGIPVPIDALNSKVALMQSAGYPVIMTETDNESYGSGFDYILHLESVGTSWVWLSGDGFVDAATGIAYGNIHQAGISTPLNITWPAD